MTWPVTGPGAKQELLTLFPAITGHKYLDDYAAISEFLASMGKVRCALREVENDALLRAFGVNAKQFERLKPNDFNIRKKTGAVSQHYAETQGRLDGSITTPKSPEFSHLVTGVFGAIEGAAGFSTQKGDGTDPPYKVMLMMPLDGSTFLANLRDGRQWKDVVGPNHGEYTHRLQWCMLIKAGVCRKPASAFKHLGNLKPVALTNTKLSYHPWDALFDRVKPGNPDFPQSWPVWAEDKYDFRSPEGLLDWLCEPEQVRDFPLVAGFLRARKQKRLAQQSGFKGGNFAADYIARKVYGMEYSDLSFEQRDGIQEFLIDGVGQGTNQKKATNDRVGLLKPTADGYAHKRL